MPHARDPNGIEARHLIAAGNLAGKKMLDVGCGNGDFTWQFAALPRTIFAIDPDLAALQAAHKDPRNTFPHVHLASASAESLPFPAGAFEVAALTSSL